MNSCQWTPPGFTSTPIVQSQAAALKKVISARLRCAMQITGLVDLTSRPRLQKFSIIHMLLFRFQPSMARWRPSGDGVPKVSKPPSCFQRTFAFPNKST